MKRLTTEQFRLAEQFIQTHARPLDQALFHFYFHKRKAHSVIRELAKFQNEDGGFGHSLEPDFRLEKSSALATTVGLQYIVEVGATKDEPIVQKAIQYLMDAFIPEKDKWQIVPLEVNDVPHAPWWEMDPTKESHSFANPGAEIVGYFYRYRELVPERLLKKTTELALKELQNLPIEMEMHDFLCYQRLVELIDSEEKEEIEQRLRKSVREIAVLDPGGWEGYGIQPLQIVTSPESRFADLLEDELPLNLDFEIERQGEDGSWAPTWSWFGNYEDVWPIAEKEWKGYLTVKTLKLLADFDRIER
ncbi:hypothetical protein [Alkalihalobacillus sp. 1P02AB]|uniref:hypothetical protein n=1 Tax=Alkalihalobacillus sp. 1P02AB TaxID=3132260 RepID=UPI0039A51839